MPVEPTTLRLVVTNLAQPAALLVASPWRIDATNESWSTVPGAGGAGDEGSVAWSALLRLCDLSARTRTARHATVHGDGADIRFEVAPIPDENGDVRHLLVVARFMVGEAHLRAADQARLDASPALIARFGPDLRVTAVNRAVIEFSGLDARQILGRTNGEMGYPDELVSLWDDTYREVFASGRSAEMVYDLPSIQGTIRYRTRALPSFDASGAVREVTVISTEASSPAQPGGEGYERMIAQVAARPESAAVARRDVTDHAVRTGAESIVDALELVVSELVANAVEHGSAAPVEVSAQRLTDVYVLDVRQGDSSTALAGPEQWSMPDAAARRGRGLAIVMALSDSVDTWTEGGVLRVRCLFSVAPSSALPGHPLGASGDA